MRRAMLPEWFLNVRRQEDKPSGFKTRSLMASPIAKIT
jgi:hypothetical protein